MIAATRRRVRRLFELGARRELTREVDAALRLAGALEPTEARALLGSGATGVGGPRERFAIAARALGFDEAEAPRTCLEVAMGLCARTLWVGRPLRTDEVALAAAAGALEGRVHVVTTAGEGEVLHRALAPMLEAVGLSCSRIVHIGRPRELATAFGARVVVGDARDLARARLMSRLVLRASRAAYVAPEVILVPRFDGLLVAPLARVALTLPNPRVEELRGPITRWCERLRSDVDVLVEPDADAARLTSEGHDALERFVVDEPLVAQRGLGVEDLYGLVDAALVARFVLERDRDYAIVDGRVEAIDRGTGRPSPAGRFARGVRPALESKERLPVREDPRVLHQGSIRSFLGAAGRVSGAASHVDVDASWIEGARLTRVLHVDDPEVVEDDSRRIRRMPVSQDVARGEILERQLEALASLRQRALFAGTADARASHERFPCDPEPIERYVRRLAAALAVSRPLLDTPSALLGGVLENLGVEFPSPAADAVALSRALATRTERSYGELRELLASPLLTTSVETTARRTRVLDELYRERPFLMAETLRLLVIEAIDRATEEHVADFEQLSSMSGYARRSRIDPLAKLTVDSHERLTATLESALDEAVDALGSSRSALEHLLAETRSRLRRRFDAVRAEEGIA